MMIFCSHFFPAALLFNSEPPHRAPQRLMFVMLQVLSEALFKHSPQLRNTMRGAQSWGEVAILEQALQKG